MLGLTYIRKNIGTQQRIKYDGQTRGGIGSSERRAHTLNPLIPPGAIFHKQFLSSENFIEGKFNWIGEKYLLQTIKFCGNVKL